MHRSQSCTDPIFAVLRRLGQTVGAGTRLGYVATEQPKTDKP